VLNIKYRVPKKYAIELEAQNTHLTERQQHILVGNLLGDGAMPNGKNARFDIAQTIKHRSYIEWLVKEYYPFVPGGIRPFSATCNGKSYPALKFATVRYTEFNRFYELFYKERVKVIPRSLPDLFNDLSLAVWFMDDGYSDMSNSTFHTQGFSVEDVTFLVEMLRDKFSIISKIQLMKYASGLKPIICCGTSNGANRLLHSYIDPILQLAGMPYKCIRGSNGPSRGEKHPRAKSDNKTVKEIRRLAEEGLTALEIANRFGKRYSNIRAIVKREIWQHL